MLCAKSTSKRAMPVLIRPLIKEIAVGSLNSPAEEGACPATVCVEGLRGLARKDCLQADCSTARLPTHEHCTAPAAATVVLNPVFV